MSTPIIEVTNLSKSYRLGAIGATSLRSEFNRFVDRLRGEQRPDVRKFWALHDVSFTINPGDVVGVIGRNGAGKSTLLKILSRITEPTGGRAVLRGRVSSLLEVGTGFHPELTGRENVFLNGAILGMTQSEVRRKFDEIVAFAEVEQFIDTPVKRYSSGMYVRLAFAVAAHLEPEILIVDEVLAVGDADFQAKCLGKMENVARDEGRTVLLVSHNIASIQRLSNRVLFLHRGGVAGFGEPLEQLRLYAGHRLKDMNPVHDLSRHPRSRDDGVSARLLSAELDAKNAPAPWTLPFASPLILRFTVEISVPLSSLELGLGLFTATGQEIVSTLSSWEGNLGPVKPGRYVLTINYGPLELVPGNYSFGIGLRSDRKMEDYLADALELEIVHSPASNRPNLSSIGGSIAHTCHHTIERI